MQTPFGNWTGVWMAVVLAYNQAILIGALPPQYPDSSHSSRNPANRNTKSQQPDVISLRDYATGSVTNHASTRNTAITTVRRLSSRSNTTTTISLANCITFSGGMYFNMLFDEYSFKATQNGNQICQKSGSGVALSTDHWYDLNCIDGYAARVKGDGSEAWARYQDTPEGFYEGGGHEFSRNVCGSVGPHEILVYCSEWHFDNTWCGE